MQSVSAILAGGKVQGLPAQPRQASQQAQYVGLRCTSCTTAVGSMTYHSLAQAQEGLVCQECGAVLLQRNGIWLALAKSREEHFRRFLKEYEAVRKFEGRGSDDSEFYLALPYRDQTGRNSRQWKIRSRTYRYLEEVILPKIRENGSRPLLTLDLGAGNGWMSYRLASQGHRPIAVDLQTDVFDGLGAAVHFESSLPMLFPRFQAEVDQLPFGCGQFDCAIFNASFHYSENYARTLGEAIRCLRPGGSVVIADSPSYSRDECGQRMVEERQALFERKFGFKSDGLASCEYLTKERLKVLATEFGVEWKAHQVWYGMRWACRPMVARLKRRREPSRFVIYEAQVKTS